MILLWGLLMVNIITTVPREVDRIVAIVEDQIVTKRELDKWKTQHPKFSRLVILEVRIEELLTLQELKYDRGHLRLRILKNEPLTERDWLKLNKVYYVERKL